MKQQLRPAVTAWVESNYPGATEVAPHSGQRFVFSVERKAIKLLAPLNDNERERCNREVSFLESVAIEGLPTVLSGLVEIEIGGYQFSLYEEAWIDADSVKTDVERNGVRKGSAEMILQQGARILRDLHSLKVVHRDISHGNVLIGEGVVSIVDLGLAKYLDLDPLTRTSEQIKMTIAFASPEQITGGSSLLESPTDIYSLALVAVFGHTGRFAYQNEGDMFVLNDYLARMAHRDLLVDVSDLPGIVKEMLNPISAYRPAAGHILQAMS